MTASAPRALTRKRLKELLSYDLATGEFRWRVMRGGKHPGDIAGCVGRARGKDYIRIRVDDELIMAHRLAWLYVKGRWPARELDHEDGDGLNNRFKNLVPADRLKNNKNASLRKDNKTGTPGVFQIKGGKYQVCVKHKGEAHFLGTFGTLPQAVKARRAVDEKFDYHPGHGKEKVRP